MLCADWITEADIEVCYDIPATATPDQITRAIDTAQETLYLLTASQWPGDCSTTEYPCPSAQGGWYASQRPSGGSVWFGWDWLPTPQFWCACSSPNAGCGCPGVPQVPLRRRPVSAITEIRIDNVALDPSAYRLDFDPVWGYVAARIDGGKFPCCQNVSQAVPAVGAWSITYTHGGAPPASVKGAAATFAAEIIKGCVGDDSCALPSGTVSYTHEGVQVEIADPQDFVARGGTGIPSVDMIVSAINPSGARRRPVILSPESPMARRVGL